MTKYQANSLRKIKESALLSRDVEALRKIREFEKGLKIYFQVAGEKFVRSESGEQLETLENIFLFIEGFRPCEGLTVQPVPGSLWEKIEASRGKIIVQELKDLEQLGNEAPKIDSPQKVSAEFREIEGVKFLQVTPELTFVSVESLTEAQLEHCKAVYNTTKDEFTT